MQFTFSNNPIDKLYCWIHNKREELSQVKWIMGNHKEIECGICRKKLDNWKDMYSPMQCGWHKIDKYTWICHSCLYHRDFEPFIEMIDEAHRKHWEEINMKEERIRTKAKQIIDLLKEYLPEYKETLDLCDFYLNIDYCDDDGYPTETNFSIIIRVVGICLI